MINIINDGDIIRGLGHATLYSAYTEEQVDKILEQLCPIEPFDDEKRRWPISRKLKHAKQLVKRLASSELSDLEQLLKDGLKLFEGRNEVVHGRIYGAVNNSGTSLQSGRPNTAVRDVTADELYDLANKFSVYSGKLYGSQLFRLRRAICNYLKQA